MADRLIYVSKHIILEYVTVKQKDVTIFPMSRLVDKQVNNDDGTVTELDEPEEMVFNGYKKKYMAEEIFRLGLTEKITIEESANK